MSDPLNPNYRPGVGRLATDRFDFQKHIDGESFRHKASSIDLFPTVVITDGYSLIDGYTFTTANTVQDAIVLLANAFNPPIIQDATTFQKGIIQLAGDIGGVATNIRVVALRGRPINSNTPATNDILTWNGSSWGPASNSASFTAAGDLSGNNTIQHVVGITGDSFGNCNISAANLLFASNLTDVIIGQIETSVGNASDMIIAAQSNVNTGNGGSVVLIGGQRGIIGGSSIDGGVIIQLSIGTTSLSSTMVHCVTPVQDKRVLGLVSEAVVDSTKMGANTGDLVVYVGNAAAVPVNPPVGGSVLYSSAGQLHVRQADNTDIIIGQTPNPDIWGAIVRGNLAGTDGEVYKFRKILNSFDALGTGFNIPLAIPNHTTANVQVWITAKQDAPFVHLASYKLSATFSNEGGITEASTPDDNTNNFLPFPPHIEHARFDAASNLWTTKPDITTSGNFVRILTGGNASTTITWFIVTEMMICPSYSSP